jgi:hypothetical protein
MLVDNWLLFSPSFLLLFASLVLNLYFLTCCCDNNTLSCLSISTPSTSTEPSLWSQGPAEVGHVSSFTPVALFRTQIKPLWWFSQLFSVLHLSYSPFLSNRKGPLRYLLFITPVTSGAVWYAHPNIRSWIIEKAGARSRNSSDSPAFVVA